MLALFYAQREAALDKLIASLMGKLPLLLKYGPFIVTALGAYRVTKEVLETVEGGSFTDKIAVLFEDPSLEDEREQVLSKWRPLLAVAQTMAPIAAETASAKDTNRRKR